MNRLFLLGRLTRDPEVRYTPNGRVVCQFNLAVDRPFKNQDGERESDFIPIVIWGKNAETAGNSLMKGQRALVEGRLQIRSYEAKDGTTRTVAECIADRFEYIERKGDTGAGNKNAATAPTFAPSGNETPMEGFGQPLPFDEAIPF